MTGAGLEQPVTDGTTAQHRRTHFLTMTWESGVWTATIECPDRHLGARRPCAVWADGDGSTREDRCTFEQYAEDVDLDEWLHARIEFQPIGIIEGGCGEEWHAKLADPLLVPPVVVREVPLEPSRYTWRDHRTYDPRKQVGSITHGGPNQWECGWCDGTGARGRQTCQECGGNGWYARA